jgi:hypothetical protein
VALAAAASSATPALPLGPAPPSAYAAAPAAAPGAAAGGGGGASPAAQFGYDVPGVLRQRQLAMMVMNVNDANLSIDKIEVKAGDEPLELANEFVATNQLGADLVEPLSEEIRRCVLDVTKQELKYVRGEAVALAAHARREAEASGAAREGLATAQREVQQAQEAAREAAGRQSEAAAAATAQQQQQQQQDSGAKPGYMLTKMVSELAEAKHQVQQLQKQLAVRAEMSAEGGVGVGGGGGGGGGAGGGAGDFDRFDADGDGAIGRAEWQAYQEDKARIQRQANEDRERLVEQNRRLRLAMNPASGSYEARMREVEEDRTRMNQELTALRSDKRNLEAELQSVYVEWRALRTQHGMAAAAARSGGSGGGSGGGGGGGGATDGRSGVELLQARDQQAQLTAEREQILKNWSEETEGLVTVYRTDKAAWEREKQRMTEEIQLLRSRVGGHGH